MVNFFCFFFCICTCVLACLLTQSVRRTNRLLDKHNKDMSTAELKYMGKCSHCYSKRISRSRPFGYDRECGLWTDRSSFDLYIPNPRKLPDYLSEDRIQEEVILRDDIYAANKAFHPFSTECIGNINPYTNSPISSADDYDEYLHSLAQETAASLHDPFALL